MHIHRLIMAVSSHPSVAVPEKIQEAERWRLLGERLRAVNPLAFERMIALLVAASIGLVDDNRDSNTESYFVT